MSVKRFWRRGQWLSWFTGGIVGRGRQANAASERAALSTDEAIDCMASVDAPFVFSLDWERGRGALVYHRYDSRYGLVTPSRAQLTRVGRIAATQTTVGPGR